MEFEQIWIWRKKATFEMEAAGGSKGLPEAIRSTSRRCSVPFNPRGPGQRLVG
ncbi:hypothetical protein Isop_1804 [Isosphaera pallida ATCC 43644]|uniref:Uncharacterized protein n=1 Tax=Isosphaera pallida (strain ATCC 43644 / DSM 9630 / IS1B) TaxID=575540 RepID=E8R1G9_ISOPI|nr:hypothetical protein Isop_1804 [Isosphaera pallida ATCC 43644]